VNETSVLSFSLIKANKSLHDDKLKPNLILDLHLALGFDLFSNYTEMNSTLRSTDENIPRRFCKCCFKTKIKQKTLFVLFKILRDAVCAIISLMDLYCKQLIIVRF